MLNLAYFGIILLIGILCSIIAKKIRIPSILLYVLSGIGIGYALRKSGSEYAVSLSGGVFITSVAILALVMIVFDGSSRFRYRDFDQFAWNAAKLVIVFLILVVLFLGPVTYIVLGLGVLLSLLFASLMIGSAADVSFAVLKEGTKNKVLKTLEIESIVNTPISVLIPFIIIGLINKVQEIEVRAILQQFLLQIVVGIGVGVLMGLIVFRVMRKYYAHVLSPLAVITAAILTYVIAETDILRGNGVIAVVTLGLFFGNFTIKKKEELHEFSATFTQLLEIIVFVLIGINLRFDLMSKDFLLLSCLLFLVYLIIRFVAVHISFRRDFNEKEKIFMSLNAPKGIAVAVIAFSLASGAVTTLTLEKLTPVINMVMLFILYSIILSSIITRFSRYFTRFEVIKKGSKEVI